MIRMCLIVVLLTGCSSVYPVTSGSHIPADTFGYGTKDARGQWIPRQPERFVVWSNDPSVEHYVTGMLLKLGYTVVERDRLQKLFHEQGLIISLSDSPEKLATAILKAGRLIGATQVIFADVRPQVEGADLTVVAPASVSVRSISVETGEVRWSGTAHYPQLVKATNELALTYWAIKRATCRVEDGLVWEEPRSADAKGCVRR